MSRPAPGQSGYIACLSCGCPAALGEPMRFDWECPACPAGQGFVKAMLTHEVPRDVVP